MQTKTQSIAHSVGNVTELCVLRQNSLYPRLKPCMKYITENKNIEM